MTVDVWPMLQAEWLKRRRSLATWLVVGGALFTPAIVIVARLVRHGQLGALYADAAFWPTLWRNSWESMAIFFLPLAAILATSLITQIEVRNNAWKQVRTLPVRALTIFCAKLAVIVVLLVQFLALFTLGIVASALVPWLVVDAVPWPAPPPPWSTYLVQTAWYLLDCLPIVAAQYLLSLHYRNFLVAVGVGFMAWVAGLAALPWKFGCLIPYTYPMYEYLRDDASKKAAVPLLDIHALAAAYALAFFVLGYVLFATKADKG